MNIQKMIYALIIIMIVGYSCDSEKESNPIIGTWKINTVAGKELPKEEQLAFIILTTDGHCEQGTDGVCELGGDNTIKGKWELNKETKVLKIKNNDGTESAYTNVACTNDDLKITHEGDIKIEFKRQ